MSEEERVTTYVLRLEADAETRRSWAFHVVNELANASAGEPLTVTAKLGAKELVVKVHKS